VNDLLKSVDVDTADALIVQLGDIGRHLDGTRAGDR
jgi:hypothetical protein